jgi:hypothetical protein
MASRCKLRDDAAQSDAIKADPHPVLRWGLTDAALQPRVPRRLRPPTHPLPADRKHREPPPGGRERHLHRHHVGDDRRPRPVDDVHLHGPARDAGWNFSQPSNAVTATTEASTDTTPPTAPTGLQIGRSHSCEIIVRWTQSTDDQDPQAAIRYRLVDNGIPDPNFSFVIGTDRWPSYGFEGTNTWVLHAVDSAGNVSAPSNSVTRELTGDDCQ